MNREEILPLLHVLEVAFRPISAEKMAIYVDIIRRKSITESQLADAVRMATEVCEAFPSIARLMKLVPERPKASEAEKRGEEPIEGILDRTEDALRAWKRRFASDGKYDRAEEVQREIDRIHRLRANRNLLTSLRPEVENFDGTPVYTFPRDWDEADTINEERGTMGYPNAVSRRSSDDLESRIVARFGVGSRTAPDRRRASWNGETGAT